MIGARSSVRARRGGFGFMANTAAAGGLLLLALLGTFLTTTAKPSGVMKKNGIRLVGEDAAGGARGRLEIYSDNTILYGGKNNTKGLWFPVCSQEDEDTPQILCEVMGYKYGRWYYTAAVAHPLKSKYTVSAASLKCYPKDYFAGLRGGRRHLHSAAATATAAAAGGVAAAASHTNHGNPSAITAAASEEGGSQLVTKRGNAAAAAAENKPVISNGVSVRHHQQHRARERSLAIKSYMTSFPKKSPYQCLFYLGSCEPNGPFAGIECSNRLLPTAPPPPPSPPSLPSSQYYEGLVRVIGGQGPLTGTVEPNLCATSPEAFCNIYLPYGRVELLVDPPGGGGGGERIWAPLCGGDYALRRAATIAHIACQMEYGWPDLQSPPAETLVGSWVPSAAPYFFPVPNGQVIGAKDFDPAAYQGWATITAVPGAEPTTLQAGKLTVSATPCNSLFALICDSYIARRRR